MLKKDKIYQIHFHISIKPKPVNIVNRSKKTQHTAHFYVTHPDANSANIFIPPQLSQVPATKL